MDPSTITSIASAVIALAALFVAVSEARATRRHNRLSVIPPLTVGCHNSIQKPQFLAEIENTGTGPAIVRDFRVFLDDEHHESFEAEAWLAIVDLLELPKEGIVAGLRIDKGEFIPPSKRMILLRYECDEELTNKQIRQAFQRIRLEIDYQSVYGDHFRLDFRIEPSLFDCFETDI